MRDGTGDKGRVVGREVKQNTELCLHKGRHASLATELALREGDRVNSQSATSAPSGCSQGHSIPFQNQADMEQNPDTPLSRYMTLNKVFP